MKTVSLRWRCSITTLFLATDAFLNQFLVAQPPTPKPPFPLESSGKQECALFNRSPGGLAPL